MRSTRLLEQILRILRVLVTPPMRGCTREFLLSRRLNPRQTRYLVYHTSPHRDKLDFAHKTVGKYTPPQPFVAVQHHPRRIADTDRFLQTPRHQATRSRGSRPANTASRLSSALKPMASRVSRVALPIWGSKKVLLSCANAGSMWGSLS